MGVVGPRFIEGPTFMAPRGWGKTHMNLFIFISTGSYGAF